MGLSGRGKQAVAYDEAANQSTTPIFWVNTSIQELERGMTGPSLDMTQDLPFTRGLSLFPSYTILSYFNRTHIPTAR